MKTITVLAEDRVGLLADVSYILGKSNLNIEALTVDVVGKKAILSLTVKDYKKATNVLSSNGFVVAEMDSIVIKIPNRPEALTSITDKLAVQKISIATMHTLSSDDYNGVFALNVDKPRKAVRLLSDVMMSPMDEEISGVTVPCL